MTPGWEMPCYTASCCVQFEVHIVCQYSIRKGSLDNKIVGLNFERNSAIFKRVKCFYVSPAQHYVSMYDYALIVNYRNVKEIK